MSDKRHYSTVGRTDKELIKYHANGNESDVHRYKFNPYNGAKTYYFHRDEFENESMKYRYEASYDEYGNVLVNDKRHYNTVGRTDKTVQEFAYNGNVVDKVVYEFNPSNGERTYYYHRSEQPDGKFTYRREIHYDGYGNKYDSDKRHYYANGKLKDREILTYDGHGTIIDRKYYTY